VGEALADFVSHAARFGAEAAIEVLKPVAHLLERAVPSIFPKLLGMFVPLDSEKEGGEEGEPQRFHDYAWQGLPMDKRGG
jgi:hypothetical protein